MALLKNVALVLVLTVTFYILETRKFTAISKTNSQENNTVEELRHFRGKREAQTNQWFYIIDIEVNISDMKTLRDFRSLVNSSSIPKLPNNMTITEVSITTVCLHTVSGFQCHCEEQFAWPYQSCITYGACDPIVSGLCGCINSLPQDGSSCQPKSTLLSVVQYIVDVELNVTNLATVEKLKKLLGNMTFSLSLGPQVNITDVGISTVCLPQLTGYQCRCEDQYRWSCDVCATYGQCSNITSDGCSCINAIPADGQFCQSKHLQNLTNCPATTLPPMTTKVANTTALTSQTSAPNQTTTPNLPVFYYLIDIEVNITNVAEWEKLQSILSSLSFPLSINGLIQITEVNISTVCYPVFTGYQCRCEDQYRWSCDVCATYGQCSNITSDGCSCINAIPADGQFCQSKHLQNLTNCPATTLPPMTTTDFTSSTPQITNASTTDLTTQQSTTLTPTTQQSTTLTPTTQQVTTLTPTTQQNTTLTPTTQQNTTLTPTTETVLNIQFSLSKDFTDDLKDDTSPAYIDLKKSIEPKLREQYSKVPGFVSASIKQFRSGSVIVDFEVKTTNLNMSDIKSVEPGLIATLEPEFIVDKDSFQTAYESLVPLPYTPDPVYSGQRLTLKCGPPPPGFLAGDLVVLWKAGGKYISGNSRFQINNENNFKTLTVGNAFTSDTGEYECTVKGSSTEFHQKGTVTVKEAPHVRAPGQINLKCLEGKKTELKCCVQQPYQVQWINNSKLGPFRQQVERQQENCVSYNHIMPERCVNANIIFVCQVKDPPGYRVETKLIIFIDGGKCEDKRFGSGQDMAVSEIECESGKEGIIQAVCQDGAWVVRKDTCVLRVIKNLETVSQSLQAEGVPGFVNDLQSATEENQANIQNSTATMSTITMILQTLSSVSTNVSRPVMEGFLKTVNVLISEGSQDSWKKLNTNSSGDSGNTSSILLESLERFTGVLQGEPFVFNTSTMDLTRTNFNGNSFSSEQTSSVGLNISQINHGNSNNFINTIEFSTLNNVLPARSDTNQTFNDTIINANVILIKLNGTASNISLSFQKLNLNESLDSVQCVFWNFDLEAWDDEGCHLQSDNNQSVTCTCNHLTSFSILMSPSSGFPEEQQRVLDYITYIGVGISMGSLLVCLIIEAFVWKRMTRNSTSYIRHVSIVNIAVSLLIADIWFIIGASISANKEENKYDACSTATFFIHFFYLSLFFWMLISGLLLLYRTIMVFSHMSKSIMLAISFSVGYGAPLIIAVVTVASTAPGRSYIRDDEEMVCWLNWTESKALLAFVIPALSVVLINFLILLVVLYKMLRRGVGDTAQSDDKHTLVVIARCLAILTPFFGLTWALGVGTLVDYRNFGIHVTFALFNSLQGFFILVFGTLLDSKIRAAIFASFRRPDRSSRATGTRSTSAGPSSSSALDAFRRLWRRNGYNVSEVANTSSYTAAESFNNI